MQFSPKKLFVSPFGMWLLAVSVMLYLIYPPMQKLNFGIDLVGGTYVTLSADTKKTVESEAKDQFAHIVTVLNKKNIKFSQKLDGENIVLDFANIEDLNNAKKTIEEAKTRLTFTVKDLSIDLFLSKEQIYTIEENAIESNIDVLRNRLNSIGVEEVSVGREGSSAIVIELPNIQDPQQAKNMIGTPAVLEFKLVESMALSKADLLDKFDGEVPLNMTVAKGKGRNAAETIYYLLEGPSEITGTGLKHSSITRDHQSMNVVVQFEFDKQTGEKFSKLTRENIGRSLAIILDGNVISAPRINSEIGSAGIIQGDFTEQSGKELAMMLNSGSFAAPLNFEEERTIEPSLGVESIHAGIISCIVGLAAIFVFSLFYYGILGLFAFLALLFNLVLVLFGMYLLGAALTLPGIAGMILTVGMAIDSSILIYEKMRELNTQAVSAKELIKLAFSGVSTVILDANITTLIVGIVLFKFGTGPVKGFAATMMLGIFSTLLTGLFFLRSLFTAYVDSVKLKKLKI